MIDARTHRFSEASKVNVEMLIPTLIFAILGSKITGNAEGDAFEFKKLGN